MLTIKNASSGYVYIGDCRVSIPPGGAYHFDDLSNKDQAQIRALLESGCVIVTSGSLVSEKTSSPQPPKEEVARSSSRPLKENVFDYKVGVVIPCHNYGRFLGDAIESCMRQTKLPSEIVVVNDRSTDNTRDVANRYPVKYFEVNYGCVGLARNLGLDMLASGIDLVLFLDADNRLTTERSIEKLVKPFAAPDVGVVYSNLRAIDTHGKKIGCHERIKPFDYWELRKTNHVDTFAMVRKDIVDIYRWEDCGASCHEDWAMWLKISRARWRFVFEKEYLGDYRIHDSLNMLSVMGKNPDQMGIKMETFGRGAQIGIMTPFVGRSQSLDIYRTAISRIPSHFKNIVLIASDNSRDQVFRKDLISILSEFDYPFEYIPIERTAIRDVDSVSFANSRSLRVAGDHIIRIAEQMAYIYSACLSNRVFDFVVTLEDDVLPPKKWLDTMLRELLVSGVDVVAAQVRNRWEEHHPLLCWRFNSIDPFDQSSVGVAPGSIIDASHFGCTLFLGECFTDLGFRACPGREGRYAGHDIAHSLGLYLQGKKRLLSSVVCKHFNEDGSFA